MRVVEGRVVALALLGGSLLVAGCAGARVRSVRAEPNERMGLLSRAGGTDAGREDDDDREPAIEGASASIAARARLASAVLERWSERGIVLRWPVRSPRLTSAFGARDGEPHDGVDLRAATGEPVLAAAPGTVFYAGSGISGYGRLVILRHDRGVSTIYAHNSRFKVTRGQRVKAGQTIALAGRSGRATGPHVHFEVRSGSVPIDPALVMVGARHAYRPAASGAAARLASKDALPGPRLAVLGAVAAGGYRAARASATTRLPATRAETAKSKRPTKRARVRAETAKSKRPTKAARHAKAAKPMKRKAERARR